MFPVAFDRQILASLPLPGDEHRKRVLNVLQAMVARRILPYFKRRRGTDAIVVARVSEHLAIRRLEDEGASVEVMSLLIPDGEGWAIQIHERLLDYLAFVIPSDPESRLGDGTPEEGKMLAFAELLLRHQVEHLLYGEHREREVILGDAEFAMERRAGDPTFYRSLRQALADEMNGLKGADYLLLLDQAEKGLPLDAMVASILSHVVPLVADLPEPLLEDTFSLFDGELKGELLGEWSRRSGSPDLPLLLRTSYLAKLLRCLTLLVEGDEGEVRGVFAALRGRWDLRELGRELRISEKTLAEAKDLPALVALFKAALQKLPQGVSGPPAPVQPRPPAAAAAAPKERSLKDRIEEARSNPAFPPQVLEVIDKNKLNAVGHSGAKYSELIETLLAVPRGKIRKIEVSPAAFEAGLNRSHYGLERPKELVCDLFTNLIWRYRTSRKGETGHWRRMGSAFLFVGPPGVGKTSFAISIAENLGIPYHKFSLGGMRDEADLRGHGFTYEGSKPGAIVQGLIKMGCMNGMFILDEADKTDKFAIATLLEILDPEQNHLFHDKYTQTTGEIDTQGRITAVGALSVKLETAYDAGCKTLIIPTENLAGEGGLERLPEALKVELQILPFAAWRLPHEPFDYSWHILQVVAVDHIVQAAEIALIREEELEVLEMPFIAHARVAAEALAAGFSRPARSSAFVTESTSWIWPLSRRSIVSTRSALRNSWRAASPGGSR
jgi:hypothetical protein